VKIFFYFVIFLLAGMNSMAQRMYVKNLTTFDDKRIHFGFTLGINTVDFIFTHYKVMNDNTKFLSSTNPTDVKYQSTSVRADIPFLTPGFTVGIVTNLRLNDNFDFRFLPGMSFGERKIVYNIPIVDVTSNNIPLKNYSIKSTFLDFPLLFKYKAKRLNNQRPYIIAGGAYRIDISKSGKDDLVKLKPTSTSIETGVGWDSYLQFFRLSTEFKFSFGLDNVLGAAPSALQNNQVYSSAFSRLSSNMFVLSFHFE